MLQALVLSGFVIANAGGTFAGLLISSYMGDYAFENLKGDIAKCLTLAVTIVPGSYALLCWAPHPYVMFAPLVVWYVEIRLLWLELDKAGVIIAGVASFFAMILAAAAAGFVLQWFCPD